MEITVEELNKLLEKATEDAFKRYNYIPTCWREISKEMWIPEACRNCSNHPSNGGSGFCQCILGQNPVIY